MDETQVDDPARVCEESRKSVRLEVATFVLCVTLDEEGHRSIVIEHVYGADFLTHSPLHFMFCSSIDC